MEQGPEEVADHGADRAETLDDLTDKPLDQEPPKRSKGDRDDDNDGATE